MCNLSEGIEEKGYVRGKAEGKVESIQALMKSLNGTVLDAMTMLQIPVEEQEDYKTLL